jgi:uncharacterized protein YfdQ (DUF2303 family)
MTEQEEAQVADVQNIAAAIRAGIALGKPRTPAGHRPYTIVPEGANLVSLVEEDPNPSRIKSNPTLHDAPSFITYINDHKGHETHIFADTDNSKVLAVIDHHHGANADPEFRPGYCDHRATFAARHSEEWKTWMAKNGKPMSQVDFATFLEDNEPDLAHPKGAELIEIAESLQVSRSGEFKSKINRNSNSIIFGYTEENNATAGQVEVPKEFSVLLRPYIGCSHHTLTAKLRYKLEDGSLKLWYDLIRAEVLRREAFDAIIKRIADETSIAVLLGTFT